MDDIEIFKWEDFDFDIFIGIGQAQYQKLRNYTPAKRDWAIEYQKRIARNTVNVKKPNFLINKRKSHDAKNNTDLREGS